MAIKTLHLTNCWHEKSGGIATFYRALMQAAERNRHPMRLIVPGAADSVRDINEFSRIYEIAAPFSLLKNGYRTIYPDQFLQPGSTIQRILLSERPDVVEVCDKYTLHYLAGLLRLLLLSTPDFRPAVVGLSCERMDENLAVHFGRKLPGHAGRKLSGMFSSLYMRNLYFPFFDHHVAISAYVAEELKKASLRHPVERGVWIRPLGVDCETFCPQRKSAAVRKGMAAVSGAGRDSFLLLYAGRLAPEKNLALVMDMIEVLHEQRFDFRLLVAGDGTRRQWLQECALPRAPGRTVFLGHVQDRGELADLIANCDAFVHPNANEPFGIAPLEAMASGIPVILPDRGGVSSYATNENSVPVRPEGSAFANAARQLAAYPGMVAAIAHNARVTAERFSWIQVTDSFLKLYATIHDVTGGRIPLHCADPEFRSTGVTETGKRATRALANLAGTCFRLYIRMSGAGRTRDDSRPPFHPPTAKVGALCSGHEKTRIQ